MTLQSKLLAIQEFEVRADKDGKNPHYKSNYVTLDNLLCTILPIATANKVSITNFIADKHLVTKVTDTESGEFIESAFPIYHEDPQKIGSAITYAKRYNLGAIFNLITEVDDDGNFASGDSTKVEYSSKPQITDYIERMRQTEDVNELKTVFTEALTLFKSEKQIKWLTEEKDKVKSKLQA